MDLLDINHMHLPHPLPGVFQFNIARHEDFCGDEAWKAIYQLDLQACLPQYRRDLELNHS